MSLQLMTVKEVADELKVSKMTIYRLCQAGKIPHLRVGRGFRIRRQDLLDYLSSSYENRNQRNGT